LTPFRSGRILAAKVPDGGRSNPDREGIRMPTYISLLSWTEAGIKSFKETLERANAAGGAAESLGGKLKDVYWTIGPYDVVSVAEFPDDETATAFLLKLGSQGAIRTTTMRAFDRDEMAGIIEKAS
jgi:uncharacterized protein with GYD domain